MIHLSCASRRQPGADITDWFNYGFTEASWRAYCARQIKMRMEMQSRSKISVYESDSSSAQQPIPTIGGGSASSSKMGALRCPTCFELSFAYFDFE